MHPIVFLSATAALCSALFAPKYNLTPGPAYLHRPVALAETPQEQVARLESEYVAALTRATQLSAQLDAKLAEAKASNDSSPEQKQAMLASLRLLVRQAQAAQADAAYKKLSWEMAQSQLGAH